MIDTALECPTGPVLSQPLECGPGVYLASAPAGWYRAARELSRKIGGQWWPHGAGLTWVNGAHSEHLIDPEMWPHVEAARVCCQEVGAESGWTVGGCARRILAWVGPPQGRRGPDILGDRWGYHDCQPGRYDSVTQWDIQSCYWTLFSRLPSMRVLSLSDGTLAWQKMTPEETSRYQDLCAVAARCKPLRNIVVGAAYGSRERRPIYVKGKKKEGPRLPGPFSAAASLIVRSAWELCREAAEETGSLYSVVDCVTTGNHLKGPICWEWAGLRARPRAHGDAHICSYGIYRVGDRATKPYADGHRFTVKVDPAPFPEVVYYREWL